MKVLHWIAILCVFLSTLASMSDSDIFADDPSQSDPDIIADDPLQSDAASADEGVFAESPHRRARGRPNTQ